MELGLTVFLGYMCAALLIGGDPATPPPPRKRKQGRYWSAKIDDISLWPPGGRPLVNVPQLCFICWVFLTWAKRLDTEKTKNFYRQVIQSYPAHRQAWRRHQCRAVGPRGSWRRGRPWTQSRPPHSHRTGRARILCSSSSSSCVHTSLYICHGIVEVFTQCTFTHYS